VTSYQCFFNTVRKNSDKGDQTPLEIFKTAAPKVNPKIAWLPRVSRQPVKEKKDLLQSEWVKMG